MPKKQDGNPPSSSWTMGDPNFPNGVSIVAYAVSTPEDYCPPPQVSVPGIDVPSIAAEGGYRQGKEEGKHETRLAVEAMVDTIVEERKARMLLEKEKETLLGNLIDIYKAIFPDRVGHPTEPPMLTTEIIRGIRKLAGLALKEDSVDNRSPSEKALGKG